VKPVEAPKVLQGGTVEVLVDSDKAQIEFDGKPIPSKNGEASIPVEVSGSHVLTVTAEGRKPYTKTIVVADGKTVTQKVKLEKDRSSSSGRRSGGDKPKKPGGPAAPSGDDTMSVEF
jgi:hypothetical protein